MNGEMSIVQKGGKVGGAAVIDIGHPWVAAIGGHTDDVVHKLKPVVGAGGQATCAWVGTTAGKVDALVIGRKDGGDVIAFSGLEVMVIHAFEGSPVSV